MFRVLATLLLGLMLVLSMASRAFAQESSHQENPGKGPVFTEPPADDPNFELMGEFVGEVKFNETETKLIGLQVRTIAPNEFEAVSFLGGLPGQDSFEPTPLRLIGRRSEGFLILSGGPHVMIVQPDHCQLMDREGTKIGRLERIQRTSPTLGARPPKDAIVLFDGTNLDHFTAGQMTEDQLLMQGADLKPMFQDFNLHIEFRLPYMPEADGQSRGNSGLYLQSRYECQILDSFASDPVLNGHGSLYRFKAPDLNMSFPPLVWQTYDVQFTAPRWAADGTKLRDAHITAWVNGVKVQDDVALPDKTGAGKQEEPVLLPTRLQDHGDPVRFRNFWLIDRGLTSGEFPVYPTQDELQATLQADQEQKAAEAAAPVTDPAVTDAPVTDPAVPVAPQEPANPSDSQAPAAPTSEPAPDAATAPDAAPSTEGSTETP